MRNIFKRLVWIPVAVVTIFLFIQTSFAQEEIGIVQKGWRKFLNNFKETPKEEEATAVKEEKKAAVSEPLTLPAAEEEEVKKLEEEAQGPVTQESTTEELYESIKIMLESEEEILDYIPELKAAFNENGEITKIEYSVGGVFKDIKELDKETLMAINNRVANERVRVINEKRMEQLERARPPQAVAAPPSIPKVPSVPTVPKVPSVPTTPQVPSRPSSPYTRE